MNLEFQSDGRKALQWRIKEDRLRRWTTAPGPNMSRREAAKFAGLILWHCHIASMPLCHVEDIIRIMQKAGQDAKSWDEQLRWTGMEVIALQARLSTVLLNPWLSKPLDPTGPHHIFLASDSSGPRWAFLSWSRRDSPPEVTCGEWGNKQHMTIFLKELIAAVVAVEHCTTRYPNSRITLCLDNTAALHVCRRRASLTPAGNELARRLDRALTDSACSLRLVYLTSNRNPADPPTRNRPLSSERIQTMWSVLENDAVGCRLDDPQVRRYKYRGQDSANEGKRCRHEERVDDSGSEYSSEPDENREEDEEIDWQPEWLETPI
jgi:hypothetical protein